jgi:hypothetical protein
MKLRYSWKSLRAGEGCSKTQVENLERQIQQKSQAKKAESTSTLPFYFCFQLQNFIYANLSV